MFHALDALWDECHDKTLGGFLSEANPHLWAGKGSVGPAVWEEFSKAFGKRFPSGEATLEQANPFIYAYLEDIGETYSRAYPGELRLIDAFQKTAPPKKWKVAYRPAKDD